MLSRVDKAAPEMLAKVEGLGGAGIVGRDASMEDMFRCERVQSIGGRR